MSHEENRLAALSQNGYVSHYWYDADGERDKRTVPMSHEENSVEVLEAAVASHGAPEIINSDQGSKYTSQLWIDACAGHDISVSMDGRGRCKDNIWIERFWRTIKTEYVYINPVDTVRELRLGIAQYIEYYNNRRPHQGIGHQLPIKRYRQTA